MRIKLLGTGPSMGVPALGCSCDVCNSNEPRNKRLRASALITSKDNKNILIDTSPDLREQLLRSNAKRIDAVYITHTHSDHVDGMAELRSLNLNGNPSIDLYVREKDFQEIRSRFAYIFEQSSDYAGAPPAQFNIKFYNDYDRLNIFDLEAQTFTMPHGNVDVSGVKINQTAYIPDCNGITEESRSILSNLDTLIIDGMWPGVISKNHFNLEQASELARQLEAKLTYLTHLTHKVDYLKRDLYETDNIKLAYDGLELSI